MTMQIKNLSRRGCLMGIGSSLLGTSLLSGCGSETPEVEQRVPYNFSVARNYESEEFRVLRVRRNKFDDRFLPQMVRSPFRHKAGTLIVKTADNYIYLQVGNGLARRYGVGVGRRGVAWSGTATAALKRRWPAWHPTPRMRAAEPTLPAYVSPGEHNPLGARAIYLFQNGEDTLYRIHGTSEPWTIGTRASSGCIRMLNEDIIDLFDRVPLNATVIVT